MPTTTKFHHFTTNFQQSPGYLLKMVAKLNTVICVALSMFMIHTAADAVDVVDVGHFNCVINDFQNYAASVKDCDSVRTLTFNVTKWQLIPQDLINRTQSINSIIVSNRSIEMIDELGFCAWSKLTSIDAGRNMIELLPSDLLANCRALNRLLLSENSISQIDENSFRKLPFLTELDLSSNRIDFLDDNVFAYLISLKILRLNNNKIQAVSADHFQYTTKLEILDLSYNSIRKIDEGAFWNLRKLTTLDVSHNPDLDALDLTQMDRLQYVNIDCASLMQLNIPENVVKISANSNKITTLSIESNGILEELYLRNNSLQNLTELSEAGQLTTLDISYNNIRDIDFSYLRPTQIRQLEVLGNPIRKFDVSNLINLPYLQTINISTDSLDKETLSVLDDGTTLLTDSTRVLNKKEERSNVVEITESTYAPSTESSNIFDKNSTGKSITMGKTKTSKNKLNVKSTPITDISTTLTPNTGNDTKDDTIRKLLDRIQKLESNQGNSSEKHRETEQSVSDLRILMICTIVAFSLFVSFQIGLFVYGNYKQWNIPFTIPGAIASSQNEQSNGRSNVRWGRNNANANDSTLDPIIEHVY